MHVIYEGSLLILMTHYSLGDSLCCIAFVLYMFQTGRFFWVVPNAGSGETSGKMLEQDKNIISRKFRYLEAISLKFSSLSCSVNALWHVFKYLDIDFWI